MLLFGGAETDYEYMSPYPRHVKEKVNGEIKKHWFSVMRIWSYRLNYSISFLPSFATPYKHYKSQVIWLSLCSHYCHSYENMHEYALVSDMSYTTLLNWDSDFRDNVSLHLTIGSERLGLDLPRGSNKSPPVSQAEILLQYYAWDLCKQLKMDEEDSRIYQYIQAIFSKGIASIGFFRKTLRSNITLN